MSTLPAGAGASSGSSSKRVSVVLSIPFDEYWASTSAEEVDDGTLLRDMNRGRLPYKPGDAPLPIDASFWVRVLQLAERDPSMLRPAPSDPGSNRAFFAETHELPKVREKAGSSGSEATADYYEGVFPKTLPSGFLYRIFNQSGLTSAFECLIACFVPHFQEDITTFEDIRFEKIKDLNLYPKVTGGKLSDESWQLQVECPRAFKSLGGKGDTYSGVTTFSFRYNPEAIVPGQQLHIAMEFEFPSDKIYEQALAQLQDPDFYRQGLLNTLIKVPMDIQVAIDGIKFSPMHLLPYEEKFDGMESLGLIESQARAMIEAMLQADSRGGTVDRSKKEAMLATYRRLCDADYRLGALSAADSRQTEVEAARQSASALFPQTPQIIRALDQANSAQRALEEAQKKLESVRVKVRVGQGAERDGDVMLAKSSYEQALELSTKTRQEAARAAVAAEASQVAATSSGGDAQALVRAGQAAEAERQAAEVARQAAEVASQAAQALQHRLDQAKDKIDACLNQATVYHGDSHEKRRKFKDSLDQFINDPANQTLVPFIKREYENQLNQDTSLLHRLMTQNVHLSNYKLKDGMPVAHTAVELERRFSKGNLNTIQPRSALLFSKRAAGFSLSAGATIGASFLLAMGAGLVMTGIGAAALVAVALVSMLAVHLNQKRNARRNAGRAIEPPASGAAEG